MLARTTQTLDPIRASAGIQANYERRLTTIIDRMAKDVLQTLSAEYTANEPEMVIYAQDASPAHILSRAVDRLSRKWSGQIADLAPKLADYFASAVKDRCDRQLKQNLAKAGITVKFKMTAAMNDAYQATLAENVGLIKSIPERYFAQVRTLTMQSVARGRDLHHLASGLEKQLGVTKRRAALISRDQNSKATAVLTRTRYLEMGITEAIWLHSAGGKVPRPYHVRASGTRYKLATGLDMGDGEGPVHPGELISCRCVPKPVIAGL